MDIEIEAVRSIDIKRQRPGEKHFEVEIVYYKALQKSSIVKVFSIPHTTKYR